MSKCVVVRDVRSFTVLTGPVETFTVCRTHGIEFQEEYYEGVSHPDGSAVVKNEDCPIGKLEERIEVLDQAHRRANMKFG